MLPARSSYQPGRSRRRHDPYRLGEGLTVLSLRQSAAALRSSSPCPLPEVESVGGARKVRGLGRAGSAKNCRYSSRQNFEIKPQGPGVNVLHIELHPSLKGDGVPPMNLPETGDAGLDAETAPLPVLVKELVVAKRHRTRPYQAHVPL